MSNEDSEQGDFEAWATAMPDALDAFLEELPADLAARLDFTPGSLEPLEAWLLQQYADIATYKRDASTEVFDGVARYIGETFRRNLGGIWDIDLRNKKKVFFGLPVLVGLNGRQSPESPHSLATASLDRRTGRYIKEVFDAYAGI